MAKTESGFSMLEMLAALLIMGVIAALALPSAITAVKNYKLHSDATAVASYLNVIRMRAAAQYAPYRVNIAAAAGTFTIERLCGNDTSDSACTGSGATAYTSFSTPKYEWGMQYLQTGNSFLSCRPSGVAAASSSSPSPGSITADPTGCPSSIQFYFNTRGLPVDNTGAPLSNGGGVIYIQNKNNLLDAITTSLGGRVAVWNYSGGTWAMR